MTFTPVPDPRPDDTPWPAMGWPVPAGVVLPGRWVTLTPADPDADAADLFAALDSDAVWEHVAGRPGSPEEMADLLRARHGAGLPWTVRAARTVRGLPAGTVLGMSSYLEVSVPDARLEIGSTAYRPQVWATVVNPECKLLLLGLAFEGLGVGRVQLKTDVRNARSQRAIARLGAGFEGTLRRYQRRADATVRDTALFSVTAPEWLDVRTGLEERVKGWHG